jgi:cyclophilin family peptidyl-prolyl cis-trans isomerase
MPLKIKNASATWILLLFLQLLSNPDVVVTLQLRHLSHPLRHVQKYPFDIIGNFRNERRILDRIVLVQLCSMNDSDLEMNHKSIFGTCQQSSQRNDVSTDLNNIIPTKLSMSDRRYVLHDLSRKTILTTLTSTAVVAAAPSLPSWTYPRSVNAATTTPTLKTTGSTTTTTGMKYISADDAKITHKVFFNVRISRPDGTFYVRDDEEVNDVNNSGVESDSRVYYGQLIFGLFGNDAPKHVQRFLEYIIDPTTSTTSSSASSGSTMANDDSPYPSYSRSSFTQYDDATGILYGGTIPSLEVVEIQQSVALRYGNRLLPAKLWIEDTASNHKISHDRMGLLTHEQFDATPVFGITTRNDTTILNPTHTVFGTLIMNSDAKEFLRRISSIPTYSIDRPIVQPHSPSLLSTTSQYLGDSNAMTATSTTSSPSSTTLQQPLPDTMMTTMKPATNAIYNFQREFFRNTAKTLGDTRINKLYNGKLLRRVEVTQVGLL